MSIFKRRKETIIIGIKVSEPTTGKMLYKTEVLKNNVWIDGGWFGEYEEALKHYNELKTKYNERI